MASEPTRAIYVRMSYRLARKLDEAAERLGSSKREILARLVDEHLEVSEDNPVVGPSRGWDRHTEAVTSASEVLTLDEAAVMLRVEPSDVLALIERKELPARRLGQQWRLSRTAVLAWLRGGNGLLGS